MTQFNVTGMSCAACSARVEKAVSGLDGVTSCTVSLLTNSMGVEGTASPDEIIAAVTSAGYVATLKDNRNKKVVNNSSIPDNTSEIKHLKIRLISSVAVLLALMYFSMGHSMMGLPLPSFFDNNYIALALVQLLLTITVMIINRKFFISGVKGIIHKSPNMDTLVSLGSSAAFLWSLYVLFAMTKSQLYSDLQNTSELYHQLYFESSAMILTLITVGKTLEAYSKGKTTNALKSLIELTPKTATVLADGKQKTIPADDVRIDDIFIVRPGDSIPVDGIIIKGNAAVNEAALTGESIPRDVVVGDTVMSGSVNQSGYLECKAVKTGENSTLAQIIKAVTDASATKAPVARVADKVSGVFVPVVLCIAFIVTVVWYIINKDVGDALARGISVLVISCPCALGLATPVAIMVGSGVGARNGILFRNAAALEEAGRADIVCLDKTGTVTEGIPEVTGIYPSANYDENDFLKLIASAEKQSNHPLAQAICREAEKRSIAFCKVENFTETAGCGITAEINGKMIQGGSFSHITSFCPVSENVSRDITVSAENGNTPLLFTSDNSFIGFVTVADRIREDSVVAVKQFREMGKRVIMLTGDNEITAKAIAAKAGIDEVVSGVLPVQKADFVKKMSLQGKTIMVGDGINDAPALTSADVGIAIGSGTDVAIESADVVVMNSNLTSVSAALTFGKKTLQIIYENLFWAFIYNVICIPLAAGVFIPLGITLSPMIGAAAMSLSSFCVVTNALRINLTKLPKYDKENKKMEITIKIKGMMCPHCEATVKKTLESIDGVEKAEPNHKKDKAVVTLSKSVDDSILISAITDAGYEVKGIK